MDDNEKSVTAKAFFPQFFSSSYRVFCYFTILTAIEGFLKIENFLIFHLFMRAKKTRNREKDTNVIKWVNKYV